MRQVTVPIDMSSEQKTILGIISKRQMIYLIIGGAILYVIIPSVFQLFPNFIAGVIFSIITAIPIVAIIFILAFVKKHKHHLNYDHYLLIRFGMKKQMGNWRKGKYPKNWMVNNK